MANSFSAANAYSGQYAQPPFYPPYMQSSGQSNTGHAVIPPIPTPPFPPLSVNAQRFEANSHVPSPPLPGQLPRDWNPDVLRQLAASGSLRFPFPPPPPPPPPQLFSATFPPHQQSQNAPAPPTPHQFQPFQSSTPQFLPATLTPSQPPKPFTEHGRHNDASHESDGLNTPGIANRKTNVVSAVPPQAAHSLDGASFSRVAGAFSNVASPSASVAIPPQVEPTSMPERSVASRMRDELHLRAKAAIKECIPMGADFDFWLQSGIDSSVLDGLFDELNIDRRSSGQQTAGGIVDTTKKPQSPTFEPSSQDVEQDSLPLSQTPQPEILDPQLERKDRIAKMLAAKSKKGQTLASGKSSQSGSPAPDRTTRPEVVQSKPVESQHRGTSKPETKGADLVTKNVPEPLQNTDSLSVPEPSAVLLTPVHGQSSSSAFAIPGLFMTSADEAEFERQRDIQRSIAAEINSTEVQPAAPKSLKRSAEPMSDDVLPQNKRQASYAVTTPAIPTAASETVTLSSPVQPTDSTLGPSSLIKPPVGDVERLTDVNANPVRSMVNQAALKDRMAALKAKMQMDKSRKQALQDGMPMLAAEVEKTRQSLEERHSNLAAIRKDIETKDAELLRLRADENELVLEIRRLDSQLIDGENGQRQFSNELSQLDNQIQVNEKESASSSKPASLISPAEPVSITALPPSSNKPQTPSSTTPQIVPITVQTPQAEVPVIPSQYESLRRSLTTEYNPEQADLDRQLESGLVPVTDDELLQPSKNESNHVASSGSVGDAQGAEASTGVSVVDEQQSELDSEDDRMSIDEASDAGSSGSASMSDSGSEDYEPALNQHEIQPGAIEDNDDYEPADAYQPTIDAENDDYEPAEQVPIIDVDGLEEDASGYEGPSDNSTPAVDESAPTTNGVVIDTVTPISSSPVPPTSTSQTSPIVSGAEQKLTIPQQTTIAESFPLLAPLSDSEKPAVSRFVPYQSPLASFKSFRFHPQFSDVVKSGFRSLTYSNNIDSKTPICSNELEGRFCDDVNCVDQHFGSMALSDDKILVQMSSANDLKDKDQRDTYLLGLKKVIAGLREQGVREFSEVANALSKYRREWSQAQDGIVFT